jgi:hypothetical protein
MPHRTRHSIVLVAAVITFACLALPGRAGATVGIRGGFSSDPDQILIGMQVETPPVGKDLYIIPSGEAGFGDDAFTLSFNGDFQYRFGSQQNARPYVGAGVTYFYADPDNGESDTSFGLNFLGGVIFQQKSGQPIFLEAKIALDDDLPDFKMIVGLNFREGFARRGGALTPPGRGPRLIRRE